MYEQIKQIGRDLFLQNCVSSHAGNISIRIGDKILITRTGAMIHNLKDRDIIETSLHEEDSGIVMASSELKVHRKIFQETTAMAIVHAHPVNAVVVSMDRDEIIPLDSEGSYLLHKVPVVATEHTVGAEEVKEVMPEMLKEYKIVMLRGHGSFAIGQMLEEAYQWTSSLEASCEMINIMDSTNRDFKEYRSETEHYQDW